MQKSKVAIMAGLLFLALAASVSFSIWKTKRVSLPPSPTTQQTATVEVAPQEILTSLQKEFQINQDLVTMHRNWFLEALGRQIPLTGQYFGLNVVDSPLLADHTVSPASGTAPYEIRSSGLVTLKNTIADFFSAQGFQRNSRNSQRDEASYSLDETLAFEKGALACLVTVRTLDPVGTFFCGRHDPVYEAQRNEFIPILNPTNDPDIFVEVSTVEGNYAKGGVGSRGGGAEWWAVKQGEQWQVVWQGQANPPCTLIEKHQFPKSIYQECDPNQ